MKTNQLLFCLIFFAGCQNSETQKSELDLKVELSKPLNEISGIVADHDFFWVITDKPKAVVYKLNKKGEKEQEITIQNATAKDVESVTKDENFVYIGDTGDNDGNREDRQIIKVQKTSIGKGEKTETNGEIITFRFSDEVISDKKKKNNYDCEAILSLGDSLYLFTKRRSDLQTELFSLPKTAGNYTARSIAVFDSKGLITDAAINDAKTEIALTGYNKGHRFPFILFLKGFKENNFFSGNVARIELTDKPWNWQVESITYSNDNEIYFACEETKEVKATIYGIKRDNILKLNKK